MHKNSGTRTYTQTVTGPSLITDWIKDRKICVIWFVCVYMRSQWSRMRRFPETILFSSIAPAGMSIRSPWLAMIITVPWNTKETWWKKNEKKPHIYCLSYKNPKMFCNACFFLINLIYIHIYLRLAIHLKSSFNYPAIYFVRIQKPISTNFHPFISSHPSPSVSACEPYIHHHQSTHSSTSITIYLSNHHH